MKPLMLSLFVLMSMLLLVTTTAALDLSPSDVYLHYTFDGTTGTSYIDSGPNNQDTTFYSLPSYENLATMDAANTNRYGIFGNASALGTTEISGVRHQVMIDVPDSATANLPGPGDSFAVSYWLSASAWDTEDGMIGAYNLNGLDWTISLAKGSANGLSVTTNDANETGNSVYNVDLGLAGEVLGADALTHFVVQFEGNAGITGVYINGYMVADSETTSYFYGNERNGFTIGGRVLDSKGFTALDTNAVLDDFAVIDGVVTPTNVYNIQSSGASILGSQRLLHYTMDDTSGSVVTDASDYHNHGTLIAKDLTMEPAISDIASLSRTGQIGNAIELAGGRKQYAIRSTDGEVNVDMPDAGEEFTVCLWLKPDENPVGWDNTGIICSWASENLGFNLTLSSAGKGVLSAVTTDGSYSGNLLKYAVRVGDEDNSLNLSTDEFHHFAVTVDQYRSITGMYIDGNLVSSQLTTNYGVTLPDTSTVGCRIKDSGDGPFVSFPLSAYLDDYAVLSGQLTEAQIATVMTSGVAALYAAENIPGDANKDGIVNGSDVTILANNWQYGVVGGGADWSMGDFNNDGKVDGSDVTILANNWQYGVTSAASVVPEPSTIALLLCGLGAFFCFKNRK